MCSAADVIYMMPMQKMAPPDLEAAPVALTDDLAGMADYVRSVEGRAAIARGIADLREGRIIEGENALAEELTRRAAVRRRG
jgi:hypothetical protein